MVVVVVVDGWNDKGGGVVVVVVSTGGGGEERHKEWNDAVEVILWWWWCVLVVAVVVALCCGSHTATLRHTATAGGTAGDGGDAVLEANLEISRASQQQGVHLPLGPGGGGLPSALRCICLHVGVWLVEAGLEGAGDASSLGGSLASHRAWRSPTSLDPTPAPPSASPPGGQPRGCRAGRERRGSRGPA